MVDSIFSTYYTFWFYYMVWFFPAVVLSLSCMFLDDELHGNQESQNPTVGDLIIYFTFCIVVGPVVSFFCTAFLIGIVARKIAHSDWWNYTPR